MAWSVPKVGVAELEHVRNYWCAWMTAFPRRSKIAGPIRMHTWRSASTGPAENRSLFGLCILFLLSVLSTARPWYAHPSCLLCLPPSPLQFRFCDPLCCCVPISSFVASLFCSSRCSTGEALNRRSRSSGALASLQVDFRVRGQTDARGIVSHNTYTNDHWTSDAKGLVNNMKNFQPSFDYMEICLWCIRVIIYWPTVFSNFSVSIKITTPSIRKSLSHEWLYVASSGRYIHLRNKLFRIEGVYDVIDQYH